MTSIHPTAIIAPGAKIGKNVTIGPYSVIGADVTLGDDVTLKAHVNIEGVTTIGEGTTIYPFASLGTAPQDLKYAGEKSELHIGRNNVIREHATMNTGTLQGGMKTIVGDNGLFMMATHIAHDCVIGNNVILANNATLGGHVTIGDHAILGGLCAVHQFVRIGAHAIIGGLAGVDSDVIPYGRVRGERAFLAGLNIVGLERGGFSREDMRTLQQAFNMLFEGADTMEERVEKVASAYNDNRPVMDMVDFARTKSRFPLCQPARK